MRDKSLIKNVLPADNTRVVLLDETTKEPYISPVICWGIVDEFVNGDLITTELRGFIIGQSATLIPVPSDDSFVGYLCNGEDSSMLDLNGHISKMSEKVGD